MSDFAALNAEERQDLIDKMAACLTDNGLGDVPISISTENVGILMAG